ncbi:hypothetical protein [Nonomuraea africana]|uniref:Uncharacterized protein n=1 Tax=Nonomuraea africana TaxID=46171 RepID=A0ABR9KWI5_9ACTN|nr:hypothetical protein [Nonomuraea africana]MBE1566401.1 hypothetical protein [Nonomuraea africana]
MTGAPAEHNRVHGFQRRSKGYSAGLWTHNSDGMVIQFNEVSGHPRHRRTGRRDRHGHRRSAADRRPPAVEE